MSPAESIRNTTLPILITHSSADAVVPFSQAKTLRQALVNNPRAEFWFNEEFAHGQLGSDYQSRVRNFFQKHL